jgi:hypothetical protein
VLDVVREFLKVSIGQRSMWAGLLGAVAVYLGYDPDAPKIEAAMGALAGGGASAIGAQLTYWFKVPRATLLKLLTGATPILYAIAQALGSTPEESAQLAEVGGGLADMLAQYITPTSVSVASGGALLWSGVQKNTAIVPAHAGLRNRNP